MRSRDGNRYLLLRLCSVILFSSLALSASEFFISYRYVVKDAIIYNETLYISSAMKQCSGKPQKELIIENTTNGNFTKLIKQNKEVFYDYIQQLGLHVEHNEGTINMQNKSTTILTLKTTCFKVDFNDNFARISALK